uniref:Uncharacterized protein n=1 Tax=Anguilla anguilla TaxID=7936 RepID=A0A0E9PXU1_ANGAN
MYCGHSKNNSVQDRCSVCTYLNSQTASTPRQPIFF